LGSVRDDLDVEAGHAARLDLVERVGDAVHAADAVGDERHPQRLVLAPTSFAFSRPGTRGGRVRDRRRRRRRTQRRPSIGCPPASCSATTVDAAASLRSCARARRNRSAW
jgi:hypothetical protein